MFEKSAEQAADEYIDASVTHLPELTLRGCFLALFITVIFTAGNVYMGLKISFTFNSAIPAAVISMAVLRSFQQSNMLENTMVQTFASAAGTLSGVIFVLPGLIMLGFWTSFPFWQTMLVCATGGLLGVMFTIPLRRALVVESTLPFPEGVAAAEIIRVGHRAEKGKHLSESSKKEAGIKDIVIGTLLASVFTLFSRGFHYFSETLAYYAKTGATLLGCSMDYSLALVGAGYLVRIRAGVAMLIGVIIAWGIAIPWLSWNTSVEGSVVDVAMNIWATKVRFIGVGTIAVAAIWTMLLLLKPIWIGIQSSIQSMKQIKFNGNDSVIRTEKDIPILTVVMCTCLLIIPLLAIFYYFIVEEQLPISHAEIITLTLLCVIFVVFMSFITASVCGYMAGLVGSSNSPISSVGVLSTIGGSVLLLFVVDATVHVHYSHLTIALVLYMSSAVLAAASVSNDNMQDLKTGQLVGATPWRQQTALMFGVIVGAMIIPFILQILYNAYGFPGSFPRAGMNPAEALSAPQAVMMSAIASGIITHHLEWFMIIVGAILAVIFILFDATVLKRYDLRLSIIALGSGIYLPTSASTALILGCFLSFFVEKALKKKAEKKQQDIESLSIQPLRRGTLLASGFIVGESLTGVAIAILIASTGDQYPIKLVGPSFAYAAEWLGFLFFSAIVWFNYRYVVWNKNDQ
jgi:putative OPT family oligopeptide transporter